MIIIDFEGPPLTSEWISYAVEPTSCVVDRTAVKAKGIVIPVKRRKGRLKQ
jgi:hypothetical protein